ncbi:MAG: VOC family protein [bacterium]
MIADIDAQATLAVKNLSAARSFYESKLGLKPTGPQAQPTVVTYGSGASRLLVYESEFAGTNKATAVTWIVGNQIDAIVKDLASKGVKFEHYDMPGMTRNGDLHLAGNAKAAWCKDPDGNILAFVSG